MKDMWSQLDLDRTIREYDYTRKAYSDIYETVYSADFEDTDSKIIYEFLLSRAADRVNFSEQLKRYLYFAAQIPEPFHEITDDIFLDIMKTSFEETKAPLSFEPTTRRPNAILKSWLTAESVRRPTIFVLGFGLRMSQKEVSDFLTKVNKEADFDENDPEEVIYRYCYQKELPYRRAKQLLSWFETGEDPAGNEADKVLKKTLEQLQENNSLQDTRKTIQNCYVQLVERACEIIAQIYNLDSETKKEKTWAKEDITSGDIEKFIYNGVPVNDSGNLIKMKDSRLNGLFDQKRLNRQRMEKISTGHTRIDRYDLITLLFFIYSQEKADEEPEIRCQYFIDEINRLLSTCHMSNLYVVNPYEAFILLCLLSEAPLGTFSDTWEMSYQE